MMIKAQQSETKNIPRLRFPGFSGEWEEKKLGDILTVIDGDRGTNYPGTSDFYEDEYCLFLNAKNVTKQGFNFNENSFITAEKDEKMRKGKLRRNDIVLTTRGSVGNIAYYNKEVPFDNMRINSGMVLLRGDQKKIDSNFIYRFLNSNKIQNKIQRISFGSAQPQLTVGEINNVKILFPSSTEQQKIAGFLGAVDEWLENLRQQKKSLEIYKKGMMQKIFSQEIRFKDDKGKDFPELEENRLNDIFEVTRGYVLAVKNMKAKAEGKFIYPVYSSQTKNNGLIGYYNEYLYDNAITWTTDGANAGNVNFREGKFYCTNVCGVLVDKKGNANKCVAELLNRVTRKYVSYVGNPKLMNNVMGQIKIKFPTVEEQQKIASFLTSLDSLIELKKQQISQAQTWKKGLMRGLFV